VSRSSRQPPLLRSGEIWGRGAQPWAGTRRLTALLTAVSLNLDLEGSSDGLNLNPHVSPHSGAFRTGRKYMSRSLQSVHQPTGRGLEEGTRALPRRGLAVDRTLSGKKRIPG
jgi:hypothetical protein